ncbi:hypothetical protein [Pedobacter glucosidilyticus]|uniref:hypothetical protein n=1 Tax=Pedobacter glucosidilyticus TaxID=1122941 RepID=UPI0026F2F2FF|nr:hypothetical protein [Pedobacter glucosidilyticus]
MKKSEYKSSVLESFKKVNDTNYILGILPNNYDEDYYYEIYITTESKFIVNLKDSIGDHIFIDLISNNHMEIYIGEYYEESCSDGSFEYLFYELKKTEKENRIVWKPKFKALISEFRSLFNVKLVPYEINRRKVVNNYRRIYSNEIKISSTIESDIINGVSFFQSIYQLFEYNPPSDSFSKLINPNFLYYPPTHKDWKVEYLELEKRFHDLKNVDVENYTIIKSHIIELYKKTFSYMLPNLKYNYNNIDEKNYVVFFNGILEKLNQTEN